MNACPIMSYIMAPSLAGRLPFHLNVAMNNGNSGNKAIYKV